MAKVTKILEATLAAGATSVTFNDVDIPNSLIRVYATNSNIYPQNISLTGNILTVTYEVQSSNMGVALELVKQGLDIIDNVTSTETDAALSANQGKVLKDLVDGIVIPTVPESITDLDDVDVTDIEDGQVLAWDDDTGKFVNVNQSGGSNEIYDSNEQIVGTYFNDILYKKSYKFLNSVISSNNTWANTGLVIPNIKQIVRGEFNRNGAQTFACSFDIASDDNVAIQTYYSSSITSNTNSIITVWYTKTS